MKQICKLFVLLSVFLLTGLSQAEMDLEEDFNFDDSPFATQMPYPKWFKTSLMDFKEDLQETKAAGKKGLIVYFGQEHCAYCRQLLTVNFRHPEIEQYTQDHFDVVKVNIWNETEVIDPAGVVTTEREYALRENTNFTPSLLFYDLNGKLVFRLRGYYPPYQFRAALEYVADAHYKKTNFKLFLARADGVSLFEDSDLNEQNFFSAPPHILDRRIIPAQKPLMVFFEQGNCHACNVLHGETLSNPEIIKHIEKVDAVQIDMWSDAPVITPSGEKKTANQWAQELGIFYAPTLAFFDEQGKPIITLDSVAHFYRLNNVLEYVTSGVYKEYPKFQDWRIKHRQSISQ